MKPAIFPGQPENLGNGGPWGGRTEVLAASYGAPWAPWDSAVRRDVTGAVRRIVAEAEGAVGCDGTWVWEYVWDV